MDPDTGWTTVSARNLLEYLIAHRPNDSPSVIGIDGRSRSGKSTLADVIAQSIERVAVVHTDDIAWHQSFFGWSEILIDGVLRPLRRHGGPVSFTPQPWMERVDPGRSRYPQTRVSYSSKALAPPAQSYGRWLDATIWVQTDADVALDRTIVPGSRSSRFRRRVDARGKRTPRGRPAMGRERQRWYRVSTRSASSAARQLPRNVPATVIGRGHICGGRHIVRQRRRPRRLT